MQNVDLCITNGNVLNVFTRTFEKNTLWIKNDKIVATGDQFEEFHAKNIINASDKYIVPGFIDSHVHIESSLVAPSELAKVILPMGTTSIFTDPHEIANVSGVDGIKYMIKDARQTPLDIFVMLPSSVPCTPFEDNGATLKAEDLHPLYKFPEVKGLAEVMDYPAVAAHDKDIMDKINDALAHNLQVDGHGAGMNRQQLDVYRQAGISTDHECTDLGGIHERLAEGFKVFLREGTVERDLQNTIQIVNEGNAQRFSFCTDDKFINTIIDEGGINFAIKLAIQYGVKPETAYTMASYNSAVAHKIENLGALSTGYQADLVFINDPKAVDVTKVMKNGHFIKENDFKTKTLDFKANTMKHHFKKDDLKLTLNNNECNVIGICPNHIETKHLIKKVNVNNGEFEADLNNDILKMVDIERHHNLGTFGLALVNGFKLNEGAVATTVAHDSHNLLAFGTNDDAIYRAIEEVTKVGGGISVVDNEKTLATMPLKIAGLMSDKSWQKASEDLDAITKAYEKISQDIDFNPFITLSFLSLPVIPTIKLTNRGLYDFDQQKFIDIER
ncbi:adenine deaminase [Apilactobacillus xinyiensis]|uniref:adenine deaminase n=1 Tax=Apilactobacillus xinyiensis TaxID=2841032 RepID=UPI001C7D280B|nr:adenine deaminase [Apilactobacillus xinyiensis]